MTRNEETLARAQQAALALAQMENDVADARHARNRAVKEAYDDGWSLRAIAEKIDRGPQAVLNIVNEEADAVHPT